MVLHTHSLFLFTSLHLIRLNSQLWQISFFSFPTFFFPFFSSLLLFSSMLCTSFEHNQTTFFYSLAVVLLASLLHVFFRLFASSHRRHVHAHLLNMLACTAPSCCALLQSAPPVSLLRETRQPQLAHTHTHRAAIPRECADLSTTQCKYISSRSR